MKAVFGTGFSPADGPSTESMWIEVEQVTKDSYIGTLNNTPFFIPKNVLRLGDHVEANMSECWAYIKKK